MILYLTCFKFSKCSLYFSIGLNEKFCLKWNDFETNISSSFKEIREERDFMDVTLACEDDQLPAHKVVLSACSPFFRTVLRRNPHHHPLLYMKGVRYNDLESLLNFMYYGEVSIAQEELNSFLAVAEELQVKGLTQKENTSSGSSSQRLNNVNTNHQTPKSTNINNSRSRGKMRPESSEDVIEELPITNVKTEPLPSSDHPVASYEEDQYQDYQEYPQQNYSDQYSSVNNYQENQIVDNTGGGGRLISFLFLQHIALGILVIKIFF